LAATPVPEIAITTTMLFRLAVVTLRLEIVELPFVVVPDRLKVIGAPE
jgi:hypothetical protein